MERVYLLLGTNLGDKRKNLSSAILLLKKEMSDSLCSEVTQSSILETAPWGFVSQDMFLNQAISFVTKLSPEELLLTCQRVEVMMGREEHKAQYNQEGNRVYESRIIDIDILLFGEREVNLPSLTIPHPRLYEREFALIPLKEIFIGDPNYSDFKQKSRR